MKQYQSKSQDLERELGYLRSQCKKIESERTELSAELGNCLKERNRLVGRTAELEKLTRYGHRITMRPEGYLESEPLKFVSARISHYACWPPFS